MRSVTGSAVADMAINAAAPAPKSVDLSVICFLPWRLSRAACFCCASFGTTYDGIPSGTEPSEGSRHKQQFLVYQINNLLLEIPYGIGRGEIV
jgi:hypothetical protein